MLPLMISDPEMRERVAETFTSDDFVNNIEEYFVQNIKVTYYSTVGIKGSVINDITKT